MIQIYNEGDRITALINGEIDHHSAAGIRVQLDSAISGSQPKMVILDFSGVSFMDSSGIGLILGRLRTATAYGGTLVVKNPKDNIKKIIQLAGISKLII